MEESSKHLNFEARRAQFEEKKRYGGGGTTLKRCSWYMQNPKMELEILRPENQDFLVMATEVDDTYDLPVSGPHGFAESRLEEFLTYLSNEYVPQERFGKSGKKLTIFRLPATGWKVGEHSAARQKARFDRLQLGVGGVWELDPVIGRHYKQTKACKVVTRIADTPLDSIVHPSLLDKHSLSWSASSRGTRPENACINNNCSSSCWSPPLTNVQTHFLQVDFTVNCEVTHISTQGRFPALLGNPYHSICAFTGAQIMDEQNSAMHQWVWKYEVVARVDSGRAWFSLGLFDGNRDMTTEVAHKLLSPVKCRYLRFHVLGYDSVPAMRVGVYGVRPGGTAQKKAAAKQMVEYRFERIAQDMRLDRVPVGSSSADVSHWFHCPYCPQYTDGPCSCKKRHRHLRRLAAHKMGIETLAILQSTSLQKMFAKDCAFAGSSAEIEEGTGFIDTELCPGRANPQSVGLSRLSMLDLRANGDNEAHADEWVLV